MPLIKRNDVNQIFASQAPSQDVPPVFENYSGGWGPESRPNNGKPTIKQSNKVQQRNDENILYIHQNGAGLPFHDGMEYVEGAPVVKDGVLVQKNGNEWKPVGGINSVESIADLIAISNPKDGQVVFVKGYRKATNFALAKPYKGGGNYIFDPNQISVNNGGTIINGWILQDQNEVSIYVFGAEVDGITDDTLACQNAVDAVGDTYFPEGVCLANIILRNPFNIRGASIKSIIKPANPSKPAITNINLNSLGWQNDTIANIHLSNDLNFSGTGFSYGLLPAEDQYSSVGRVTMTNVHISGFEHGIRKVNGNIGNKYYDCNFMYNKYGVYATGNQVAIPSSATLMHSGCDYYYTCNFSQNTVACVAYYDTSHGSGQWLFENCLFQFNTGFGAFFDLNIPDNLFSPIVFINPWFEDTGGVTVTIDRLGGGTSTLTSSHKFVSGTDDIVTIGGEDYKTRVGLGVANPKRLLHLHASDAPIIQLTNSAVGNSDANRGGLIYFTDNSIFLENKETGSVLSLGDSGSIFSKKGKIGYGVGSGGSALQPAVKDRAITLNNPTGRITTANSAITAGGYALFILNNSHISQNDTIILNVQSAPSGLSHLYSVRASNIADGSCNIYIKNESTTTLSEAIVLTFCVLAGSN